MRVLGQETADKGVASAVGVNNSVKNIWLEKVVDNLLNIQGKHFYTIAKGITDTRGQMSNKKMYIYILVYISLTVFSCTFFILF